MERILKETDLIKYPKFKDIKTGEFTKLVMLE